MAAEVADCARLEPGPICHRRANDPLTVWVPEPEATAHLDGVPLAADRIAIQGGTRLTLTPPSAGTLVIDAGSRRARVTLVDAPLCPAVEQARALRRRDPDGARAALDAVSPSCTEAAASLRARMLLDARRFDEGLAALQQIRATTSDRRRWFDDGVAALYTLTFRWPDDARARALADEMLAADDPLLARARAAYHAARHAIEVGDLRRAGRLIDDAAARAERLGDARLQARVAEARARIAQALGRFAEADRVLDAIRPAAPCAVADARGNLGWHRLRWRGLDPAGPDPGPALRDSLAHAEACGQAWRVANAHVNLALDAEQRGDRAAVDRHLAAAERPGTPPFVERWRQLTVARHALGARPPDVERARRALAALDPPPLSEMAWRVEVARGRLALAAGDRAGAERRWRAADALAARQQALVPVHAGRGGFLAERSRAARLLIDLLALDRPAEAARVARTAIARLGLGLTAGPDGAARRSRYRALRAEIDAAHRGLRSLPADQLAPARARLDGLVDRARTLLDAGYTAVAPAVEHRVESGVVELVLHAGDAGGWAFATDEAGTRAARVEAGDPAGVLAAFADLLARARRVDVRADGAFAGLDLHAAPLDGRPLIARVPVVYRFAVPGRSSPATPPPKTTLLVRDPRGDLPAARALDVPGARVLHQAAATRSALLAALPEARRLIYAGHGRHDGWQSALELAAGTRLTVADIATMPHVPAEALLAGCETAVGARAGRLEVGLAHAFLLAGGQRVIGATRVVPDALADRVTRALLALELSPEDALQRVQRALAGQQPATDWAAFRVWAP